MSWFQRRIWIAEGKVEQFEIDQIHNLEDNNPECQNCTDTVYMDDLGDGFYRCPICGEEWDTRFSTSDPFEDDGLDYLDYDIREGIYIDSDESGA